MFFRLLLPVTLDYFVATLTRPDACKRMQPQHFFVRLLDSAPPLVASTLGISARKREREQWLCVAYCLRWLKWARVAPFTVRCHCYFFARIVQWRFHEKRSKWNATIGGFTMKSKFVNGSIVCSVFRVSIICTENERKPEFTRKEHHERIQNVASVSVGIKQYFIFCPYGIPELLYFNFLRRVGEYTIWFFEFSSSSLAISLNPFGCVPSTQIVESSN